MTNSLLLKNEAAALVRAQVWRINLMILAVFGVVVPLIKGLEFFDPFILGAYTCLGAVFASPAAASALADISMPSILARITVCVVYGELMVLCMTILGILTVYFNHLNGPFFPPALDALLKAAAFGLLLTTALTALAVILAVRTSPGTAKLLLRLMFLAILVWFFLRGRSL